MLQGFESIVRSMNGLDPGNYQAVLFYFTLYSFAGWLLENGYSWFRTGVFFKEGFLWGPFKPMYGFAPVILLFCIGEGMRPEILLLLCLAVPLAIEYFTGALLLKIFHRRWWDYAGYRFQVHRHICLSFSLCWVFLSLGVLAVVQPAFVTLYVLVYPIWASAYPWVLAYFLADAAYTVSVRRSRPGLASGERT